MENKNIRKIPFSPPDMTEAEAKMAADAIMSGWITTGPRTKEFERKIADYCHVDKAVCLSSCTAAMEMALRLIGVGPDDEVIIPAYTYTATASVTQHVGCRLVMVDSQKDNVEMDYDQLADAITEHTKVIMPVDLGGIVCDYDRVFDIVRQKQSMFRPANAFQRLFNRIIVVDDAAHGFGAERGGKRNGSIADFTAFSFHAVKNLTTAEGGALTWNVPFGKDNVDDNANDYYPTVPRMEGETWNEMLYRMSQLFSLHGQNKDALAKTRLGAWEYDIIGPWYKCNMTDIMAAIGLVQFERYPQLLERRHEIIRKYNEGLKDLDVSLMEHVREGKWRSDGHLYLIRMNGKTSDQRNEAIRQMAERGIACNVHYKPLPMMTAYKALGFDIKNYPNAYHLFENEITFPLHTRLSDEDIDYIISNFREVFKGL